jgi:hypothetical protein
MLLMPSEIFSATYSSFRQTKKEPKRATVQIAALALSSGTIMIDFKFLPAPVAVQWKLFQFCLWQNLGVCFLPAFWAEEKTVFIYFHFLLLWFCNATGQRGL